MKVFKNRFAPHTLRVVEKLDGRKVNALAEFQFANSFLTTMCSASSLRPRTNCVAEIPPLKIVTSTYTL